MTEPEARTTSLEADFAAIQRTLDVAMFLAGVNLGLEIAILGLLFTMHR
jgi:hypothetical protein